MFKKHLFVSMFNTIKILNMYKVLNYYYFFLLFLFKFLNTEIFIKVTKITIQQSKTQGLIHDTLYNIQPGLLHADID